MKPIEQGEHPADNDQYIAEREQSDDMPQEQIVGRIKYFGSGGDVGEVLEFDNKEKYLEAIKKELNYNPDGFRAETIIKDPKLRKSVDDLYYVESGTDNPKTIEDYIKVIAKETVPTAETDKHIEQHHPFEPSTTTSAVGQPPSQTDGQPQAIGQSAAHATQPSNDDGCPSLADSIEKAAERLTPQSRGFRM